MEFQKLIDQKLKSIQFFMDKAVGVSKFNKYCKTVCNLMDNQADNQQILTQKYLSLGAKMMNAVLCGGLAHKVDIYQNVQSQSGGGTFENKSSNMGSELALALENTFSNPEHVYKVSGGDISNKSGNRSKLGSRLEVPG